MSVIVYALAIEAASASHCGVVGVDPVAASSMDESMME